MSHTSVIIPSFKYTQVNKAPGETHAETILTPTEVIHHNMIENMKAFDESHLEENAIFIFAREKLENGDWRYGCASIPVDQADSITIKLHGFNKIPAIFFNVKDEVIKVVRKVINNLAFI